MMISVDGRQVRRTEFLLVIMLIDVWWTEIHQLHLEIVQFKSTVDVFPPSPFQTEQFINLANITERALGTDAEDNAQSRESEGDALK